jgi:hypothetical protein
MKINHSKKNYFFIRFYKTGKVLVEPVNATNFHPSYIGELRYQIGDKDDYVFTACEEKNIEKTKLKVLKKLINEIGKEVSQLKKQFDAYKLAEYNILNKNDI